MASNIYFPALVTIAKDLDVTVFLVNLTVTTYLIFQGIAPSLWGPVSDAKGRRSAYICTFIVSIGANVGLALTKNYATLIVLRCLQSTGSASTIAVGAGVIGDITTRADRGGYMGIFQVGTLVPIAVGPVIGGLLAGSLGWRSIFWFLTIYSCVLLFSLLIFLPETLRSLVGNGSRAPESWYMQYPLALYHRHTKVSIDHDAVTSELGPSKHIDVLGPLRILFSKQAFPIVFFFSIYFAVWQMGAASISPLFKEHYNLSDTQAGLTFIGNGLGAMIGTMITGRFLDTEYRRVQAKYEAAAEVGAGQRFPLEKARLRLIPIFASLQTLSVVLFGWTIEYSVHIAVPIIATFITGWTSVSTQTIVTTYLVDMFSEKSAAATASLNLCRCLFAAAGTSFIAPMINKIGAGAAFSACAAAQVVAVGGLVIQRRNASRLEKDAG